MTFSKIDKKVLAILIIALLLAVVAGFFVFKYIINTEVNVQNSAGGVSAENTGEDIQNNPEIQIGVDGVGVGEAENNPGLIICLDKCGDGICQGPDPACDPKSLNCVCSETPQECPQDCAQ